MKAPDGLAAVVALRQLAGRETPIHKRIADTVDGAERLAAGMRGWKAFAPRRDALDRAITQADGIARGLRELRAALQEVPPDAA